MPRSIEAQLAELRSQSLHRRLREFDSPQRPVMRLGEKELLNFSSNDYLGLATEPLLGEAAKKAIDEYGVGSGASRLVSGTLAPHAQLERSLAEFKRAEAALTFSSGYAAALGTLGALLHKDDVLILDKLSHACLIDGARLSGAIVRVFPHNHLGKLESHLQWARDEQPDSRIVIATESVFSMDGDRAPLAEIAELKSKYGAMLFLDEAHALGVIGGHGRGLADELGLTEAVDIQMGTLSKALGVAGGYICGSRLLIDLLINRARSFIFSTAPPPACAAAADAAIRFLLSDEGEERRKKLWSNLQQLRQGVPEQLLKNRVLESAIVPIVLGAEDTAVAASKWLAEKGFFIPAIRYPTVARGSARLRVTVSASHSTQQIGRLCGVLTELSQRL